MNCHQCDNRIQQSLDQRNNPRLDPEIRDHVSQCASCRRALELYLMIDGSLSASALAQGDKRPSPSFNQRSVNQRSVNRITAPESGGWRRGQHGVPALSTRWLPVTVAALLLLGCFMVLNGPAWRERAPSARLPRADVSFVDSGWQSEPAQHGGEPGWLEGQNGPRAYRLSELLQRDLSTAYVNTITDSLTFDPLELVPAEPVRTVQSFPRTLASIAPWYRYSGELPLLGRWVNGVHCTLGILELSIPTASSAPKVVLPPDLGGLPDFDRSATC